MSRSSKAKKTFFAIIFFLVVIVALIAYHYWFHSESEISSDVPVVGVEKVDTQNIPLTFSALGNLLAPQSTMLEAEQPGIIRKIYFQNGQSVKKGTLLLQLDDTEARAQYNKDLAMLAEAKATYRRYIELNKADPNVLAPTDIDTVRSDYKADEATLAGDAKTLAQMQIRAPFSGLLGATNLSIGSYLNAGDAVVNIVDPNDLEISYSVPQEYFGKVTIGQKVSFTVDAYPQKTFQGTVIFKAPLVDETSGAFDVRTRIDNPAGLSPGMVVHVTQVLVPNRLVLAVPTSALVSEVSGFGVYQVDKGKVTETYVKIGEQSGNNTEIQSGLNAGDEIIVEGNGKVEPGMAVSVASHS